MGFEKTVGLSVIVVTGAFFLLLLPLLFIRSAEQDQCIKRGADLGVDVMHTEDVCYFRQPNNDGIWRRDE